MIYHFSFKLLMKIWFERGKRLVGTVHKDIGIGLRRRV